MTIEHSRTHVRSARRFVAAAAVVLLAAVVSVAAGDAALASPSVGASPAWPANPDWQKYVQSPASTKVSPVSVVSTTGNVTDADALIHPKAGTVATLTATPLVKESHPVTVSLDNVSARYVRLDVTKLGLAPAGDNAGRYVQLAEMQVFGADASTNLAVGKTVTTDDAWVVGGWAPNWLTDGVTNTESSSATGWTTNPHPADYSNHIWATIDLGTAQTVTSVVLWPRSDTLSTDGRTASFPVDYTIQSSATDDQNSSFSVQKTIVDQEVPAAAVETGGASILLDYGKDVGGYPTFDVSDVSGTPTLLAGYSETRRQVGPKGDGIGPWASGDGNRFDSYQVTRPGRITNGEIQGGERYEMISLTSPGTLSLSAVGITYTPYIASADKYAGYFVSSSDELNKYWYNGAYTNEINMVPANTVGARWNTDDGSLDVPGTKAGTAVALAKTGKDWTDYTVSFKTKIVANQAGWVVRGTDPNNGYLLILGASDNTDAAGGTNTLQQFSISDGNFQPIGKVALTTPVTPREWHDVKTVVSGTSVTTFLDGAEIASFDSAGFAGGITSHSAGTVGFRQFSGEEAMYSDISVTNAGKTLFSNSLSTASAIGQFDVPGNNAVPLILDGAKRDRAVWSGDLAVEGPTLYYSTGQSDYLKGSIELLGSYAGANGEVSGMMPPTTPINTKPLPPTPASPYSANYSMYFVRSLGDYYQYTADSDFVKKEWPIVAGQLTYNASLVNSRGLLQTTTDNGADWDYYDGSKAGEVTTYNALYYRVLLDGATLAHVVGDSAAAQKYTEQASALKAAINAYLFNSETGVYNLSSSVTDVTAQDANIFAVLFGIAPADKVAGILSTIKTDLWTDHGTLPFSGDTYQKTISPFISGFELNARFESGDTADALALLSNEWGPMIAPGDLYTGTFWENLSTEGKQATDSTNMAHGWSTMPTSALSKYVLGIQPVTAGYKTWLVQPHPGDLAWTKGKAPTPNGALTVNWSHDTDLGFAMHVEAPAATSGTIAVPTFGKKIDITVNGKKVWSKGDYVAGVKNVKAATANGDYVDISVAAGVFDISSGPDTTGTILPSAVTITGQTTVGSTLKAHSGSWGTADVTLAYRWLNKGVAIPGATKSSYRLTKSDNGDAIAVRVTASAKNLESVSVTSSPVTVQLPLTSTPRPIELGIAKVGHTMVAVPGIWRPWKVTLAYQWYRDGTPVNAATTPSYRLASADKGTTITVKVTGSRTGYLTVSETSRGTLVR